MNNFEIILIFMKIFMKNYIFVKILQFYKNFWKILFFIKMFEKYCLKNRYKF